MPFRAPGELVEVPCELAKVEITWIEFTLYGSSEALSSYLVGTNHLMHSVRSTVVIYLGIKVDIGEVRYTRYNWHSEPVLVVNREMQPQCGFRRRYTFLARASLVRNMLEQNT